MTEVSEATTNSTQPRVHREARLRWIPLAGMRVSPVAQRELNQNRVDRLVAKFDLEQMGNPTVSERAGGFWLIDGQHRIEALKFWLGEGHWEDQHVQCWTYTGLSEEAEAEKFLKLNDYLAVDAYYKFRVGVAAGREAECEINRVVMANGCVVSRDEIPGAIRAVGTLRRVYDRSGSVILGRTIRIIRDAYGDSGLEAPVIDGIGHVCGRFNSELDEQTAVDRLKAAHGGANGLLGTAEKIRRQTGAPKGHSVAAAAVEIINRGKGGKKLPSWWKS